MTATDKAYRAALVVAVVIIIWLAATLAHVENQRYALQMGMCREAATGLTDFACLQKVETRTGWWWHLFYGLKG